MVLVLEVVAACSRLARAPPHVPTRHALGYGLHNQGSLQGAPDSAIKAWGSA